MNILSVSLYGWIFLGLVQVNQAALSREVRYVGCMSRGRTGMDAGVKVEGGPKALSVQSCVMACWYHRYRVAGIQDASSCFCGHSTRGLSKKPDKECDKRCPGNCYQACGGTKVLSVYRTGYIREPTFAMRKKAYLRAFIGCYDSRTAVNKLCPNKYNPLWTKRMTIPMCIYYCDSMYQTKFSTVAATDKCCCSNSVHGVRNTILAWCDSRGTPCDGDRRQGCIGTQEKTLQWSTHQRERLPKVKRWSKSTFRKANWLRPNFKAGEEYHMTEISPKIKMSAGDATLLGLMAKNSMRSKSRQGDDKEVEGMAGADKREPKATVLKESAAVVDLPGKISSANDEAEIEKESNTAMFVALAIGFAIVVAAAGIYLYSQKKKKESQQEADDVRAKSSRQDNNNRSGEDRMERRRREKRRKKRKKKRERDEEGSPTAEEESFLD